MLAKFLFSSSVCILLLAAASTTMAGQPAMGEGFFPYDSCPDEGDQNPLYDCGGGLMICEVADISWIWKEFYNKDDEPLRYWERQQLEGGLYEQGNPENFLPYIPLSLTYEYDYAADETTITGVWALINIPGYGQIFHDIGRLVVEGGNLFGPRVFEAGKHEYFDQELEAVCDYLASH